MRTVLSAWDLRWRKGGAGAGAWVKCVMFRLHPAPYSGIYVLCRTFVTKYFACCKSPKPCGAALSS